MSKKLLGSATILIGTIIGAGIFGVPYAIAQVGFFPGIIYLLIIALINILALLAYAEVVERTKEERQITGHAEKYLGKWGKALATFVVIFGSLGAMLVYMIGIGTFAETLLQPSLGGSAQLYSSIFFVFGSLAILGGLGMIVKFERVMVAVILGIVLLFAYLGVTHFEPQNLNYLKLENILLPYGVLLFAFGGLSAVPEMKRVLGKTKKPLLKYAALIGMIFPLVTYMLFSFAIVGVTGSQTSPEAIAGFSAQVGGGIVALGAILGVLTMGTSFLTLGLIMKEVFVKDYKFNNILAWILTCFTPYVIYLAGLTDFIKVITVIGAVTGGLTGILVLMMHQRAKTLGNAAPSFSIKIPKIVKFSLYIVFVLGIVYEIIFLIVQ